MKKYLVIFVLCSAIASAQKQKNFAVEIHGQTVQGIGNNFIADGLDPFWGFGIEISRIIYKNFGLSLEYNTGYAEVKDISVFGELQKPSLTSLNLLSFYRYSINPKFDLEGNVGIGSTQLMSESVYRNVGFREGGTSFILGGKALYSLTKNNTLYLVGGPRIYFLSTSTDIENAEANRYYSHATLLNFSLGLRLYF